jgi:plasmid stability protein
VGQLLVRGLEASEIERLKQHARDHARSLEGEVRVILREAAKEPTAAEQAALFKEYAEWADAMRKKYEGRITGDSADLIREDRDSR